MSKGELWGLFIGVAGTLAGIGLAIYYGTKQSKPHKQKLQWNLLSSPLFYLHDGPFRAAVEVMVQGNKLENPYFTSLVLRNIGKSDLRSEHFDQGRPIEFKIANTTETILALDLPPSATLHGDSVRFGPELLASGAKWTVQMISDGKPYADLLNVHLADTEIEDGELARRRAARQFDRAERFTNSLTALGALVLLGAVVLGLYHLVRLIFAD